MKGLFSKSDKMRAAMRAVLEEMKAIPAEELLEIGDKHADSDTVKFLVSTSDDVFNEYSHTEYTVNRQVRIGFSAANEIGMTDSDRELLREQIIEGYAYSMRVECDVDLYYGSSETAHTIVSNQYSKLNVKGESISLGVFAPLAA